jgi:hypothetical protein
MYCKSNILSDRSEPERGRSKERGVIFIRLLHTGSNAPETYQTQEVLIYLSIFVLRVCGRGGGIPLTTHILHNGSYGGIVPRTLFPLNASIITLTADFVVGYLPANPLNQQKAPSLPHMHRMTPLQRRRVFPPLASVPPNHNQRNKT